jgi:hypothetical protein
MGPFKHDLIKDDFSGITVASTILNEKIILYSWNTINMYSLINLPQQPETNRCF